MQPAKIDLTVYQGSTFEHTVIWKAGDPAVAVNMTGYTARMQIRNYIGDDIIMSMLTTENGKIVITPLEGKIFITISAAETSVLTDTNFKSAV